MMKVMAKSSSKLLVSLIVLTFSASIFMPRTLALSLEDTATASIERAENALVSAYQVVLEAEQVGANVSALLARLNDAGELLTETHIAFRLGDFDEALNMADLCSEIGERVRGKADELRVEAYGSRTMGFWLTTIGSLVGAAAVGFGGFWGWRVFKRRYHKRVLRMKPEVGTNES